MNPTKVTLSTDELELVTNAQILLTKNEIIRKVYDLFGLVAEDYVSEIREVWQPHQNFISPKISKGENYNGLPYVMLDYPREFKRDNTFAIRTFFWWGNFFSITLQLSGEHKELFKPALRRAVQSGTFKDWYIGVGEEPWEHHFEESNYRPISNDIDLLNGEVIKLAKKIPLQEWDNVQHFLQQQFSLLLLVLTSNTVK